jgi:hypothetical protein
MTTQKKFQDTYDCFIRMSNIAFNYNQPAIAEYTTGKAEAFEQSATIVLQLANSIGITIEIDKTDIQRFRDQERKESCQADAESDSVKEESFD